MRWLILKTVLMLGVMAGGVNYLIYQITGKSLFDNMQLSLPSLDLSHLKQSIADIDMPEVKLPQLNDDREKAVSVYKWVDENGVINYTQTLPKGVKGETVTVFPNANLIQANPPPTPEGKVEAAKP